MADDRMKNDDELQRNMGGAGRDEGQNLGGQQSPGRSGQGHEGGQHAGGYGGSQQKSNFGGGQNKDDMEDDDLGAGNAQTGGQGRGGQNR